MEEEEEKEATSMEEGEVVGEAAAESEQRGEYGETII